jgi:hypothetical protein
MKASSFKWLQPSFAALFRWRHIKECCRSQRPILGTFQSRRMRLNVDAQRRHDSHTSLRSTHLFSHLSMTLPIRLQSLVSCNDPGRRLPIATHSAKSCQSNHVATQQIICRISQIPATACAPSSSLGIEAYGHPRLHFMSVKKHLQLPITSTITVFVFARRVGNQK